MKRIGSAGVPFSGATQCTALAILLATAFHLSHPAPCSAQSVRASGSTTLRYLELRTLERDSVPSDEAVGTTLLRQTADGRIVRCIPGEAFCRDTKPGPRLAALPAAHDLQLSAWGFGEGIRLYSHMRVRHNVSGESDLWPRSDDHFDLLALFGEVERGSVRIRGGRQSAVSGLGFYNYDGVGIMVRTSSSATFEGYLGRSLVRGLNEPRTSAAIESVESLPPPSAGTLMGIQARIRPSHDVAVGGAYQVDFRADGRGVYSELIAANAMASRGNYAVEGSIEVDAAGAAINEARLRLQLPSVRNFIPHIEYRHYRPYFELWTIWGAFSPVGFSELRTGASWSGAGGTVLVRGDASYRSYGSEGDDESLDKVRNYGWGAGGQLLWTARTDLTASAAFRIESGFGSAGWDGTAAVRMQLSDRSSLSLQGTIFERAYEFRISDGSVAGIGSELSLPVGDRMELVAALSLYRHLGGSGSATALDWNQRRGSVRLNWTVGPEPGVVSAARGGR